MLTTVAITVMRTIHIVCSVFWVITTTVMVVLVHPALSDSAGRFALRQSKLHSLVSLSALIGIVTGIALLFQLHGLDGDGIGRVVLRLAGGAGVFALLLGNLLIKPITRRMSRAKKAGLPVDPMLAHRQYRFAVAMIFMQWVALIGMSAFRYL